jgi:hypothetical protein
MIYFMLYLIGTISSIKIALLVVSIIGLIVSGTVFLETAGEHSSLLEDHAKAVKYLKMFLAMFMLFVFIPTGQTLTMMMAGNATFEVLASEEAKEIGGKSLELLNKYLDKELESGEVE